VAQLMKVMIVDENKVMREKIAGLLSRIDGIDAVSQLSTFGKLEQAVQEMRPQIILLDAGIVCREKGRIHNLQRNNKGMKMILLTEDDKEFFERGGAASEIRIDGVFKKQDVFDSMKNFVDGLETRDNGNPQI
jgi:DNA-binding NarL/FixJ family response regulator